MKDNKVFNSIQFLAGANKFIALPSNNLPEIAFWGRSNVGKSSAINSIFNNKTVARVSKTPGRTQQINLFILDNNVATIADLPGYGYAKVSKTVADNLYQLCYDYLHARSPSRIFLLIDARRGIMDVDNDVIDAMRFIGHKICFIFTKIDLIERNALESLKSQAQGDEYLMISNKSGYGVEDVRKKIIDIINATKDNNRKTI